MKQKLDLTLPVLVDPDLAVIKSYGILNEDAGNIPHPTAMIVNKEGNIAYLFAESDYSVRPEASDMIDVLEALEQGPGEETNDQATGEASAETGSP